MFKLSNLSIKQAFSIPESIKIIKEVTGNELNHIDLLDFQKDFSIGFHIDLDKLSANEKYILTNNIYNSYVIGNMDVINEDFFRTEKYLSIRTTSFSFFSRIKEVCYGDEIAVLKPMLNGVFSINYNSNGKLVYENGSIFFNELCPPFIDYKKSYLVERVGKYRKSVKDGLDGYFKFFRVKLNLSSVNEKHVFITAYSLEKFINKILFPDEPLLQDTTNQDQTAELQARIAELEKALETANSQKPTNGQSLEYDGNIPLKTDKDKLAHAFKLIIQQSKFIEMNDGKYPTYSQLHTMLNHIYPNEPTPAKNTLKKYLEP